MINDQQSWDSSVNASNIQVEVHPAIYDKKNLNRDSPFFFGAEITVAGKKK